MAGYVFSGPIVLHRVNVCFDIFPLLITNGNKKKTQNYCVN